MNTTTPRALRRGAAAIAAFALLLGACGSEKSADNAKGAEKTYKKGECRTGADAAAASAPKVKTPAKPTSKLVTKDLIEGCGTAIPKGKTVSVTVNYVGRSQKVGEDFDSSWTRGQPASFDVGTGRLIKGWEEGLVGAKEGGRRELLIPSDLAYGDAGNPPAIAESDTLLFVIDIIAVTLPPDVTRTTAADAPADCRNAAGAESAEAPDPQTLDAPSKDLQIIDNIIGCDAEIPEGGASVTVNYVGRSQSTGKIFDSSFERGEPATFNVGVGAVIAGWDQGLIGMKVGGRRTLIIPGSLAYGPDGQGADIGPDDTLVFVIDLIQVG